MRSKRDLTPLADLLPEALKQMGLQEGIDQVRVRQAWEKTAPAELGRHLHFLHFLRGTLTLQPDSSVWVQTLRVATATLIRGINESLGEELVKEIQGGGSRQRRTEAPRKKT